jgi:hypothetical protein
MTALQGNEIVMVPLAETVGRPGRSTCTCTATSRASSSAEAADRPGLPRLPGQPATDRLQQTGWAARHGRERRLGGPHQPGIVEHRQLAGSATAPFTFGQAVALPLDGDAHTVDPGEARQR